MNEYPEPHPDILLLVEFWEEYRREAYRDSNGVWTVGFGHGARFGVPPIPVEGTIVETVQEAEAILISDLKIVAGFVRNYLTRQIEERPFWACVSLTFNTGAGHFRDSMLRKLLNAGVPILDCGMAFYDHEFITAEHRDTHEETKLRGLARRRLDEWDFFLTKDTDKKRLKWTVPNG
jgi:GH24 family phage-related lysozyme (muramidase)